MKPRYGSWEFTGQLTRLPPIDVPHIFEKHIDAYVARMIEPRAVPHTTAIKLLAARAIEAGITADPGDVKHPASVSVAVNMAMRAGVFFINNCVLQRQSLATAAEHCLATPVKRAPGIRQLPSFLDDDEGKASSWMRSFN
nr:hypothetical protein [Burkholderia metallica]